MSDDGVTLGGSYHNQTSIINQQPSIIHLKAFLVMSDKLVDASHQVIGSSQVK